MHHLLHLDGNPNLCQTLQLGRGSPRSHFEDLTLPYKKDGIIIRRLSSMVMVVETDFGLTVRFHVEKRQEIQLHNQYRNYVS